MAVEGYKNCEKCGKRFLPIDVMNFHCQKCQPCTPIVDYKENDFHPCGNQLTEKEILFDHCLKCDEYLNDD